MKKIFAIMIAVFLAVAMIIPVAAAPNSNQHTITINNSDSSVLHTYEAYRVFEGNLNSEDKVLTDIKWSNGVIPGPLVTELKSSTNDPDYYTDFATCTTAEDVAKVLVSYGNDSAALDNFARIVGKHLRPDSPQFPSIAGTSVPVYLDEEGNKYTDQNGKTIVEYDSEGNPLGTFDKKYDINVTGDGYYFIKDKDDTVTAEGESYSKYMLEVVHNVTIDAKDDHLIPEKKIVEANAELDSNEASIGDTINYKVSIDIPKMNGYKAYTFVMNDTFSKGLEFQSIKSVVVGSSTLTKDEDYTVTTVKNANGTTTLTVTFINFIQFKGVDGDVVVTYSAKLDTDAVIGGEGNPNTVNFTYSNNPSTTGVGNGGSTGITPDDTTTTFTTALNLLKVDGNNNSKVLEGAKFQITGDGVKTVITTGTKYEKAPYTAEDNETVDPETYYLLEDGTYSPTAPDPAPEDTYVLVHFTKITTKTGSTSVDGTTGPDGKTNFSGLGAGTYTLTELEAPDGYNLLPAPIDFTINWSEARGFSVASDDHNGIIYDASTGTFSVTIENNEGEILPNTGGIGTTIFMIVGGVLILGAAVVLVSVLVSRKRTSK